MGKYGRRCRCTEERVMEAAAPSQHITSEDMGTLAQSLSSSHSLFASKPSTLPHHQIKPALHTLIPLININLTIASTAAALFLMKNTKIILPFLLRFLSQASQFPALIHKVFSFLLQTIARDIIILPFICRKYSPFYKPCSSSTPYTSS